MTNESTDEAVNSDKLVGCNGVYDVWLCAHVMSHAALAPHTSNLRCSEVISALKVLFSDTAIKESREILVGRKDMPRIKVTLEQAENHLARRTARAVDDGDLGAASRYAEIRKAVQDAATLMGVRPVDSPGVS